MAVFPCDWSGHRYPQAQQSLYVTRVLGQESETWKLRFCPRHFDEAYSILRERTTEVDDTTATPSHCELCEDESTISYYIKVYALRSEVMQRALDACPACATVFEHDLHVANGRVMTGA
jgi:hypothetical protein